jgi:hypothetical protein
VVSLPHIILTLIAYTLISVAVAVIVAESVEKEGFEIFRCVEQLRILSVVVYGCETLFENRVLRRIFGSMRDEVKGNWKNLQNQELNPLTPNGHYSGRTAPLTSRR